MSYKKAMSMQFGLRDWCQILWDKHQSIAHFNLQNFDINKRSFFFFKILKIQYFFECLLRQLNYKLTGLFIKALRHQVAAVCILLSETGLFIKALRRPMAAVCILLSVTYRIVH